MFYEKISDTSENKLNNEIVYCPISIVISSHYSHIDFFKELLSQFYKIIKFDSYIFENFKQKRSAKSVGSIKNETQKINSFQKMELLNYLNFCCLIPRPPNKSILTLEMRFDNIKCKFQSLKEIPTSEHCIEVLFDILEISVIIKLFIALLFEKQIIILANQNMLLFCICESLLKLIFPFRWLYTYIPNLPNEKSDILEIKRPYLIGINSDEFKAAELINKYPSNIICDVYTSTLYGITSNLRLPFIEEMKIKTKLLLLKDKYRNNYDEFDMEENIFTLNDYSKKSSTNKYEDVDFNLSFAENVQNIFFKLLKNRLMDVKKEYVTNEIFDGQKFLDSFDDEDYKLFYEKILVTKAFDYFITSMKFLDHSLSSQFNLIYNYADTKLKGKANNIVYYNYSFIIPKILKLSKRLESMNELLEIRDKNISLIFSDYNDISTIIGDNLEKLYRKNSCFSTKDSYSEIRNTIGKNKKYNYLNFYGKNGFIEFVNDYDELINYSNILLEENIALYKNILSDDIINEKTDLIFIPNNDNFQSYLIVGSYFYNYLLDENEDNIINCKEQKQLRNKNKKNNSNQQSLLPKKYKGTEINKEIIFNLFLKAYRKNQDEFPRNLFITILQYFSLDELKSIKPTNLKYIDKSIKYQILKIQKISYELMVIKDSDYEDINKKNEKSNSLTLGKVKSDNVYQENLLKKRIGERRKTSTQTLLFIPNDELSNSNKISERNETEKVSLEFLTQESEDKLEKTKLNVIVDSNKQNETSETILLLNKGGAQQSNNQKLKHSTMKNVYKLKKRNNSGLRSWNNIKILKLSPPNQIISMKSNLNTDPMELEEKICIKLYTFLCSKKIENFTEKNNEVNYLKGLAHSSLFDELKNLILSLKYISLEELSKSRNNYYCFWLNLYNFLTVFSVIYKCEVVSNLYEWFRFLKNSYFTIGNVDISLLEIEAYILRDKNIIKNIYGMSINNEKLKLPNINKFDSVINFGISLPTFSSPDIRIYYPSNFIESLKYSASLYFSRNLKLDLNKGTIEIPEYIKMIEPNFDFNKKTYNEYFEQDFIKMIKDNPSYKIITGKFNWNLNFSDFINY